MSKPMSITVSIISHSLLLCNNAIHLGLALVNTQCLRELIASDHLPLFVVFLSSFINFVIQNPLMKFFYNFLAPTVWTPHCPPPLPMHYCNLTHSMGRGKVAMLLD